MTSRSCRSKSAPSKFDTPQTHQISTMEEYTQSASEEVTEQAVPRAARTTRPEVEVTQGLQGGKGIVVHIPGQAPDTVPLMSPSLIATPALSQVNTPHLPEVPLKEPTHIAQAEKAPNWARTSPSQAPLLSPDERVPPFRLPSSLYHLDPLPGVFGWEEPRSTLNPFAKSFVPASQRQNSKSTEGTEGPLPPANDFEYNKCCWLPSTGEVRAAGLDHGTTPPHYSAVYDAHGSPVAFEPLEPFYFTPLMLGPGSDKAIPESAPAVEPEPTTTRPSPPGLIKLAKFDEIDMYPEYPIGADVRLVKRYRRHRSGPRAVTPPDIPDPVDEDQVVSPLLCDLGGHKEWEQVVPHLLCLAKRYGVPVPDHLSPLSNSRLQVVLKTIIKILLRHHDPRRPIEARPINWELVNPPDALWLLVHTAHQDLLSFLHITLTSLRRGCEGTQRGVALELLDRIVVTRMKGQRWASHTWRKRQCDNAKEHDYQIGVQAGPTDLRRVTWREMVMLLRKEDGWTLETESYVYDCYGTTF